MAVRGELLGTAVLELTVDPTRMDAGMAAAEKRATAATDRMGRNVGQRFQSVGKSMESTGSRMSRSFTVPILAGAAAAGKLGIDFQRSMELIHTQAGATQGEVTKLSGSVLELARSGKISASPNELSAALFRLEGAGLRGAKAMDALKASAQLAAVGNANVEDTAKTLAQTWFVGIKGAGTFRDTVAQLNATVGAGDLRLQQLVDALGTGVLGAAKLAGLTLHDVTGALAVFGDETNNVSGWASQFATALHFLTNPTKKATGALAEMGLGQFKLSADMNKPNGLVTALKDLKSHLEALPGGLTGIDAKSVLGDIFPGGRGRVMAILMNQLDRLQMKIGQIHKTTDQFNSDVTATQHTAAFQIKSTLSALEASGIQVGNDILPPLLKVGKDVADEAVKIAHGFTSLPKGAQDAIVKGGLLVAGIGPALKILGMFTGGVGRLYDLGLIAGKLATGKGFDLSAARKVVGGKSLVSSMEVGEMIVKNMIGGPGGAGRPGGPTGIVPKAGEEGGPSLLAALGLFGAGVGAVAAGPIAVGLLGKPKQSPLDRATKTLLPVTPYLPPAVAAKFRAQLQQMLSTQGVLGTPLWSKQQTQLIKQAGAALKEFASTGNRAALDQVRQRAVALEKAWPENKQAMQALVRAMDNATHGSLPGLSNAAKSAGDVLVDKFASKMQRARDLVASTSGDARKIATLNYGRLRDQAASEFDGLERKVAKSQANMTSSIRTGSKNLASVAAQNFGKFATSVRNAMASGVLATSKGSQLIAAALNATLKAFGEKPLAVATVKALSPAQLGAVASGTVSSGAAASPHAQGGLFQVGRAGERGRDTVPLNVGGADIVVGRGEKVAVFNHDQQAEMNSALAMKGYAGLPGLFSRVRKPHYMAKGGIVGSKGSSLVTASDYDSSTLPAGRRGIPGFAELSHNYPAGVNADFSALGHLPMGSRINVTFPARAGGRTINIPKVDVGAGGPAIPPATLRAVDLTMEAAHELPGFSGLGNVLVSIGGLGRGAIGAAIQQILAPNVKGRGTIPTIVRAALKKAAGGANAYEAAHAPVTSDMSGAGGGPFFPVTQGKAPQQVQWALAAAQNIAARHPAYGHLGAGWGLSAYDCSSYVSTVMDAAGIWPKWAYYTAAEPINAHTLPGHGKWITIATRGTSGNDAHTMMEIDGHFFESSHPGSGPHVDSGWSEPFDQYRHPRGFAKGGMLPPGWGMEGRPGHQPTDAEAVVLSSGSSAAKRALVKKLNPGMRFATGAASGLLTGFTTDAKTKSTTGKKPKKPKPKKAKHRKPLKLPKFKALPGFKDQWMLDAINSKTDWVTDLGGVAGHLTGVEGLTGSVTPLVTLADGTQVINWDGMIDPSTGQWAKGINQRLGEIGDPGSHPNATATRSLATELGIDEQILDAYLYQQSLAGRAYVPFQKWLSQVSSDKTKYQDLADDEQATIDRLTKLKERLPQQKKDRDYAITQRFRSARHRVSIASAKSSYSGTGLLADQIAALDKEKAAALAGVPTVAPSDWTGTKKGWVNQRHSERLAISAEFSARHTALTDDARQHNLLRSLGRSEALFALTSEENAEKHKLDDQYSGRSIAMQDDLRDDRTKLGRYKRKLTTDQGLVNTATGSGGAADILKGFLDPYGAWAQGSLGQTRDIDIPTLLQERADLLGTTVPASTSPATTTLTDLQTQLIQQQGLQIQVLTDQYRILKQLPPFGGSFLTGGVVPGPLGEPRTVIAHGGEPIFPAGAQLGGDTAVHVHLGQGMEWLRNFVSVEVQRGMRDTARRVKPLPGARAGQLSRR